MFKPEQFTSTQWSSAEDKAKFANHFVTFVRSRYDNRLFYSWFYERLSQTFSHITHDNRRGFYKTWFKTRTRQLQFLERTAKYGQGGNSADTYSDVEKALAEWVKQSGLIEQGEIKLVTILLGDPS